VQGITNTAPNVCGFVPGLAIGWTIAGAKRTDFIRNVFIDEIFKCDFIHPIDDGQQHACALDCADYWGSALIITTTARA
jgi:hypothetical protein